MTDDFERPPSQYGASFTFAERRTEDHQRLSWDWGRARARQSLWLDPNGLTGGVASSTERWTRSGATVDELAALQGEPNESIQARKSPPDWLRHVAEASTAATTSRADAYLDDFTSPTHLLSPFWFLISHFEEVARSRISALRAQRPDQFISDSLFHELSKPPLDELLYMAARSTVLEFNLWSQTQRSQKKSTVYADFFEQFRSVGCCLDHIDLYQPLGRLITEALEQWTRLCIEFAERLLDDARLVRRYFSLAAPITGLEWGVGDSHNDGRRVAVLICKDETKFLYKPRSMAIDKAYSDLASLLQRKGNLDIRAPRSLDRGKYGWAEFVSQEAVSSAADASAFYRNHGVLLSILHLLGGNDMHAENVVAAGRDPVAVDLETIIQPRGPMNELPEQDLEAFHLQMAEIWSRSVLATGTLPSEMFGRKDDSIESIDLSAMGNSGPQRSLFEMPTIASIGSNGMRVVRAGGVLPESNNTPVSSTGQKYSAYDFVDDIETGFRQGCDVLKKLDSAAIGACFSKSRVRVVLRPTMVYGRLLAESWHPDLVQDGLDRSFYWEVIHASDLLDHLPLTQRDAIVEREIAYLANRDIPMFTCESSSIDLLDADGEVIVTNFFDQSPIDAMKTRLDSEFSEDDLYRQRWLLRASFTGRELETPEDSWRLESNNRQAFHSHDRTDDLCLEAASTIADRLQALSAQSLSLRAPAWMTLNLIEEKYWSIGAAGFDLFGGSPGIAVFLSEAGRALGRPELTTLAVDVFEDWSMRLTNSLRKTTDFGTQEGFSIGAFGDLGGYLMLALSLEQTTQMTLPLSDQMLALALERVHRDNKHDVVAGSAGAILAASYYLETHPEERMLLALVEAGVERLRRGFGREGMNAWSSAIGKDSLLAGFSHGQTGIIYALCRAAKFSSPAAKLAHECASAAWTFEDALYDAEQANWRDARVASSGKSPSLWAWCHGAPGILLGRIASEDLLNLSRTSATHDVLDKLRKPGARVSLLSSSPSDSICHGTTGNLLALSSVAELRFSKDTLSAVLAPIALDVLNDVPRSGAPVPVNVPTALVGTAGIGLELLRWGQDHPIANLLSFSTTSRSDLHSSDEIAY